MMKDLLLALSIVFLLISVYFFISASPLYIVFFHLILASSALYFLYKKDWKTTLKSIGVPGDLRNNIIWSIAGFFAVIIVTMLINLVVVHLFGIGDVDKVVSKVATLPLYLLFFAFIVAPFTEELFFRAFLSTRIGMVGSSLLFGISHYAYGSIVEIVGAFILGLVFCMVYRRSKSVIPCIAVHFAYNLLSLMAMGMIFR